MTVWGVAMSEVYKECLVDELWSVSNESSVPDRFIIECGACSNLFDIETARTVLGQDGDILERYDLPHCPECNTSVDHDETAISRTAMRPVESADLDMMAGVVSDIRDDPDRTERGALDTEFADLGE